MYLFRVCNMYLSDASRQRKEPYSYPRHFWTRTYYSPPESPDKVLQFMTYMMQADKKGKNISPTSGNVDNIRGRGLHTSLSVNLTINPKMCMPERKILVPVTGQLCSKRRLSKPTFGQYFQLYLYMPRPR